MHERLWRLQGRRPALGDVVSELDGLRAANANLHARVAELEAELVRAHIHNDTLWSMWCDNVRPGWRMWRVRRRAEAREAARTLGA
jgi:hypothetical protein